MSLPAVVEFVKPTMDMVRAIAGDMREADRVEIAASHGQTPLSALEWGLKHSEFSVVVKVNGVECVMLGLVRREILSGVGVPWLLGANAVLKHRSQLLRCSPPIIEDMLKICPILYNHVHIDNIMSVRWLRWLGFTIDEPQPLGLKGELFSKFHKER